MKNLCWSDEAVNESKPFLLFIVGDEIYPFTGSDIPDVVEVYGMDYTQNEEPHTIYYLRLPDNVRYVAGWSGVGVGRFAEVLNPVIPNNDSPYTLEMAAKAFGVSIPSAMSFLKSWEKKFITTENHADKTANTWMLDG